MMTDSRLVERLYPQTKVIEVARALSRRGAASAAKFAIDRYEIDERCPRAELNQADIVLPAFHGAAKSVAIEAKHPVEVDDAKNEVIDLADMNHLAGCVGQISNRE